MTYFKYDNKFYYTNFQSQYFETLNLTFTVIYDSDDIQFTWQQGVVARAVQLGKMDEAEWEKAVEEYNWNNIK